MRPPTKCYMTIIGRTTQAVDLDLPLFKKQKACVQKFATSPIVSKKDQKYMDGLLNLLDAITDAAVPI